MNCVGSLNSSGDLLWEVLLFLCLQLRDSFFSTRAEGNGFCTQFESFCLGFVPNLCFPLRNAKALMLL